MKLVDSDGTIRHGYYREPLREVNLADSRILPSRALRRFRFKEWVGWGITHPDFYLSMIIQDARYLASSALYVYDRRAKRLHEYACTRFDQSVTIAPSPWEGECRIEGPGYRLAFEHRLSEGRHVIRVDLDARGEAPAIRGELALRQELAAVEPLVVAAPVRPRHAMYTHKAPMPVSGQLSIGNTEARFDPKRDLANLDEHRALYPYRTSWRWMTFAAFDAAGRIVGANLSDHMMKDEERLNENCTWVDGRIAHLGRVDFELDRARPLAPWRIRARDGRVDLRFAPEAVKYEKRQFGVAAIDYFQVCGTFAGHVADPAGARREVSDVYGVCEKLDTRF
jgi:hypothetical protein